MKNLFTTERKANSAMIRQAVVKSAGVGCLCCASLFLFVACEKEEGKASLSARAPHLGKKVIEEKPTPEHRELTALRQEIESGSGEYDSIRRRLYALPAELSRKDAVTLLELLLKEKGALWSDLGWAAIVNDGFNVLRQLKTPLPELPGSLLACYQEKSRPMVLRDYALQHMGLLLVSWYRAPGDSSPLLSNPAEREAILLALMQAVKEQETSLAGTAFNVVDGILTSCSLSGATPPLGEAELAELGKAMVVSGKASEHARISALGFLGNRHFDVALTEARQLMKTETTPPLLRAAAIHYLGLFSRPDDRAYMEGLSSSSDIRLAMPAQEALKKYS